jgi:Putative metal-binding motif
MTKPKSVGGSAIGVACAVALALSCSDDTDNDALKAALARGCLINTDCNSPLVCAFRKCHQACDTTRDCPEPARCVESEKPFHVCQLPEERDCFYNSDCAGDQVCAVDGQCRDQCASDRDCIPGQVCTSATCAEPSELVNGRLVVRDGGADAPSTGATCGQTSDCESPLVCLNNVCAFECMESRDCDIGQECLMPDHVCVQASVGDGGPPDAPDGYGGQCTYASDCPEPLICRQGACVYECLNALDCSSGQVCVANRCSLDIPDGAPDGYGNPCNFVTDCPPHLVCGKNGVCVEECKEDYDCLTLYTSAYCCSTTGTCVYSGYGQCASEDAGSLDAGPDAPAEAGTACTNDTDCLDTLFCNGYEQCLGGHCVVNPKPPCDDENPCTTDTCDEATKQCTNSPQGPVDADNDGHFAIACGGTADDCNDQNNTVYPGHPELCDGIDNNCNGEVDEGTWTVGSVVTLPKDADAGTFNYVGHPDVTAVVAGIPTIARRTDGTFWVAAIPDSNGYPFAGLWRVDDAATTIEQQVIEGPEGHDDWYAWPDVATNGTDYLLALLKPGHYTSPGGGQYYFEGGGPVGLFTYPADSAKARGPSVEWNGSSYSIVWGDEHEGTPKIFVSTISASGTLGAVKPVLPDVAESAYMDGTGTSVLPPALVMGEANALIAWNGVSGTVAATRWVVYDKSLASALASARSIETPIDSTRRWLTSAAHADSTYALAFQDDTGETVSITRLNGTTGEELGTVEVSNPLGNATPRLAEVGNGFMLTAAADKSIRIGWASAASQQSFALQEIQDTATTSGANVAAIDDKTALAVWQAGGDVKMVKLTCGP